MRKRTVVASWIVLAVALTGCDPTLIADVKLETGAASFEPSPLTLGVGRSEGLTLRLSDPAIDEVNLRCPAAALTLSSLSCEPPSSCTIEQQEIVGIDRVARLAVRRTNAITMQVSGLSAGGSYVSANVWRHRSCDFVGFCTEPAESFASVTVQVVP